MHLCSKFKHHYRDINLKKKQLISYNLNSIVDKDKINKNMESSLLCSQNNMTACVELLAAKNAL